MLPHKVRTDWPQQQCSQIYPADVSWCGDDREHTCRSECTDCCLTPVRPTWGIAYNYGGWMHDHKITALRSCVKVEVAVRFLMASVDVKQHRNETHKQSWNKDPFTLSVPWAKHEPWGVKFSLPPQDGCPWPSLAIIWCSHVVFQWEFVQSSSFQRFRHPFFLIVQLV